MDFVNAFNMGLGVEAGMANCNKGSVSISYTNKEIKAVELEFVCCLVGYDTTNGSLLTASPVISKILLTPGSTLNSSAIGFDGLYVTGSVTSTSVSLTFTIADWVGNTGPQNSGINYKIYYIQE